jgi:hypothetical protein
MNIPTRTIGANQITCKKPPKKPSLHNHVCNCRYNINYFPFSWSGTVSAFLRVSDVSICIRVPPQPPTHTYACAPKHVSLSLSLSLSFLSWGVDLRYRRQHNTFIYSPVSSCDIIAKLTGGGGGAARIQRSSKRKRCPRKAPWINLRRIRTGNC